MLLACSVVAGCVGIVVVVVRCFIADDVDDVIDVIVGVSVIDVYYHEDDYDCICVVVVVAIVVYDICCATGCISGVFVIHVVVVDVVVRNHVDVFADISSIVVVACLTCLSVCVVDKVAVVVSIVLLFFIMVLVLMFLMCCCCQC